MSKTLSGEDLTCDSQMIVQLLCLGSRYYVSLVCNDQPDGNISQRPLGVKTINNLTCVKNKVDQNPPPIFVNLK